MRVGFARQEKRKRRFRPDEMRDIAHAGCLRTGRAIRERQIARHHALLGAVIELLILLQVRLHDAQLHAVDEGCRVARQPQRAVHRKRGERRPAQDRAAAKRRLVSDASSAITAGVAKIATARNVRPHSPISAAALRQHQRPGQRIAVSVPGKSGQHMTAQPFGDGERGGERQNAPRALDPHQPREARSRNR